MPPEKPKHPSIECAKNGPYGPQWWAASVSPRLILN